MEASLNEDQNESMARTPSVPNRSCSSPPVYISQDSIHERRRERSVTLSTLPETGVGALWKSGLEVAPVFILAGVGMVVSGMLLDNVSSSWQVFKEVPALLILVPALLGLKGNLEMTLGARLGSLSADGKLRSDEFGHIVVSNLMAVQCQAIIVGAVAATLATAENYLANSIWNYSQALLLTSSAITAASVASFVLSLLMIGIVVLADRIGVDPDNITAPVAGMLGDFCTLGIVCLVADCFWNLPPATFSMLSFLLLLFAVIAILCAMGAYRSEYTVEIMKYGWYPVLASMLLSNLSGPISEHSITRFKSFARFQVVMNGAGGNLGAILSSKMSSDLSAAKSELVGTSPSVPMLRGPFRSLHKRIKRQSLCVTSSEFKLYSQRLMTSMREEHQIMSGPSEPLLEDRPWTEPGSEDLHMKVRKSWVDTGDNQDYVHTWTTVKVLTGSGNMVRFARLLLFLIAPGQAIFACFVVGVASSWTALPTPIFLTCFILSAICQVVVLEMVARTFVIAFWRMKIDPDNAASPLVCGMGDLVGTSFMTVAFMMVQYFGGEAWPGGGL